MPDLLPVASVWLHLLIVWAASATGFALLWAWCQRRQDATAVDVAWAAGIGLASVALCGVGPGDPALRLGAGLLIGAWSARLTLHLAATRLGHGEDGRYAKLRRDGWGAHAFFIFFQFQAALVAFFSIPAALLAAGPAPGALAWVGGAVALIGIIIEGTADLQLARFKADPGNKGKVCRVGWWNRSRHPNYFGEILHWTGIAIAVFAVGGWPFALLVPVVLTFLILRVTGIPATEAQVKSSRGEAHAAYAREVPVLIPRIF